MDSCRDGDAEGRITKRKTIREEPSFLKPTSKKIKISYRGQDGQET
jgi:hypothetical protein